MKRLLIAFGILVLVAPLLAPPALAQTDSLTILLKSVSSSFQDGPDVLHRLPALRMATQVDPNDCRGLSVDVIFQEHAAFYQQGFDNPESARRSQQRVEQLLDGNYDVIAAEGQALERITMTSLFEWAVDMAAQMGVTDTSVVRQRIQPMIEDSGVYRFIRSHPNAYVTGTEDFPLNRLHLEVLQEYWNPASKLDHATMNRLADQLSELRSRLAVAKLVRTLKAWNGKRGCLVIGYNHTDVVRRLLDLKITGYVHDTRG